MADTVYGTMLVAEIGMIQWLESMQPWGAFLLRLTVGISLVFHGWGKVIPHGGFHGGNTFSALNAWAHTVASMGIPAWMGYVSAVTEFVGGALLIIGLMTRFTSFLIAINMAVAIWKVTWSHGFSSSELAISLLAMALMLLFYGAGALAVDNKMGFS